MNRRDRLRAFRMRLNGKTWAEIGEALNYTGQGAAKDLAYVIRKGVRRKTQGGNNSMKSPYRDPQQEAPACTCGMCGGEVYVGEIAYIIAGRLYCSDCFKDYVKDFLETSPAQLADILGFETKTV